MRITFYGVRSRRQAVSHKVDYDIKNTDKLTYSSLKKTTAKMAAEQNMTHRKMQVAVKATKADIIATKKTDNLVSNFRPVYTATRLGGTVLKQPHI